MQQPPQDDGADLFARTLKDIEEQFYATFPAARVAMMHKHWQLANGYSDPLTDFVYAYDPTSIDECLPPHANSSSSNSVDSAPSVHGFSLDLTSPHASTLRGEDDSRDVASLSPSPSAYSQPPSELDSMMPALSLGFSATYPSNFRSSSLSAAVVPVQGSHGATFPSQEYRRDSRHQEEQPLQILSVPVVPSNNSDRPLGNSPYPQLNFPASSSGWVEPPPMRSLDDGSRHLNHYHLDHISVPTPPSQQARRPHSMPYPPEPNRDVHHRHFDSPPSSTVQTSYSAPATARQFVHSGPLVSYGLDAPYVNNVLAQPTHIVPSHAGPMSSPSSPMSVESPDTPTDGDDQAAVAAVQQPASAVVAQTTTSSTVSNGSKPAKKSIPEKKPPLACLFCRGRKIACGSPVPGGDDHTCNQCHRRGLVCEYPAESRRGMRRKRSLSDLEGGRGETKRSSSKSQKTRR